jgi:hypothetical protein
MLKHIVILDTRRFLPTYNAVQEITNLQSVDELLLGQHCCSKSTVQLVNSSP